MDKTSCTLKVESKSGTGTLYLVNGDLADAECGDISGPDAALEIVSWRDISFEFENICEDRPKKINMPLMHLLMEGLKRRDDREAGLIPASSVQKQAPEPSLKTAPAHQPDIPVLDVYKEPPKSKDSEPFRQDFHKTEIPAEEPLKFKKVDKSEIVDSSGKKRKIIMGAVIAGVVIVAFLSVFLFSGSMRLRNDYQKMFDNVAKTPDYPEKLTIINNYISSTEEKDKESEYFKKANALLAQIKKEKAEKEFSAALREVKDLPLDDSFVETAKRIYTAFLRANPDTSFANEVNEKILKLPELYEASAFEKASSVSKDDPEEKARAVSEYIKKFPSGKNLEPAKKILSDAEQLFFNLINEMSKECVSTNDFAPCVDKIDSYRKIFGPDSRKFDMDSIQANMRAGKELAVVRQKASEARDDLDAKRLLYYEFLRSSRDDTDSRRQAKVELDDIEKQIADKKDWESSRSYATNPAYPARERVKRVESFIARKPKSIYVTEAKQLLASMGGSGLKEARESSSKDNESSQSTVPSVQSREQASLRSSATHSDYEKGWALIEKAAGSRFRNNGNGTFTDTMTGKIWCVLDSSMDAGRCLNYDEAQEYVKNLNTGGSGGWRLPTASELFSVYKNSPALPFTGAKWYWTSDATWRGVNEIVRIVRPGVETEVSNETTSISDCGSVRAVK